EALPVGIERGTTFPRYRGELPSIGALNAKLLGRTISAVLLCLSPAPGNAANFQFFEPLQPPRACQVIAHRGEAQQAPQNTCAALQRCIEDGVEWAEVDIRLTKDGSHVLWHDSEIPTADGKAWKIAESSLDELTQLDVGSAFASRFAGERPAALLDC